MTALEGVWERARQEYQELEANSTQVSERTFEHTFCLGYVFGVAFGLALSTVRPELVRKFAAQYRKRGWLDEHDRGKNN